MRRQWAGTGALLTGRLKALPRTLAHDLWTTAVEPPPRPGRPGLHDWLPALLVPLVVCTVPIAAFSMNTLVLQYELDTWDAVFLGGIQSAALIAALYRPVPAWWVVTTVMIIVALTAKFRAVDSMLPWTGPGIVVQAGVLLMMALRLRPRIAVEALALSVVAGLACVPYGFTDPTADTRVAVAVLTTAVVVGAALRGRQVARTELVAQEERTAEERNRRTLLEERNRIARELHDVVAHHMSVISIQAQVAPHLVENPSDELKENLAGIRENAVDALTELRRVLGVLRSEDALSAEARHTPQPTLDRLPELLDNVRGAGLRVTTDITGAPRAIPPGVGLSAFRIVQESLSNTMRHAPGTAVRVGIGYLPKCVTVRVTNTAPDTPAPPPRDVGHGLLGMRERTAMLAGEFTNGPTPEGGYEVVAILPLEESV
ncbi:sensor histidine kinase [Streptomyces laculatispora]|uniref:sensor histidine kinase n=1 Tax=Streptomyces laculatispora TaxID=887464 RepID=UPI001A94FD71|nr:histidine kinase [Streptomyces laculatispora]MBO0916054.1 sensor histidine kinase [Streptomyces laculatispora]